MDAHDVAEKIIRESKSNSDLARRLADACSALDDELNTEIDDEESDARVAELQSVRDDLAAHAAAGEQASGGEFLAYTSTHADSEHDIPTAWQVVPCSEDECLDYLDARS